MLGLCKRAQARWQIANHQLIKLAPIRLGQGSQPLAGAQRCSIHQPRQQPHQYFIFAAQFARIEARLKKITEERIVLHLSQRKNAKPGLSQDLAHRGRIRPAAGKPPTTQEKFN